MWWWWVQVLWTIVGDGREEAIDLVVVGRGSVDGIESDYVEGLGFEVEDKGCLGSH
ncbi:hypothetical protein Dimus_030556, partial [Dionaea muscipula]